MHRALLLLVVLVAGCTQPTVDDVVTEDPPPVLEVPDEVSLEVLEDGIHRYTIDQGNLSYENSFVRIRIEARNDTLIEGDWRGRLADPGPEGGCLTGAMATGSAGVANAIWVPPSDLEAHGRIAGASFSQDLGPALQTFDLQADFGGSLTTILEPGQSLVVDLGGSSPELLQGEGSRSEVTIDVEGEHRIEAVPGGDLACGTGAREAEGSVAGASLHMTEAELGGEVAFTSHNASTMWVLPGQDRTGQNAYTTRFLDEQEPLGDVFAASSPEPGEMALVIDRSVDVFDGGAAWLFVDAYWGLE